MNPPLSPPFIFSYGLELSLALSFRCAIYCALRFSVGILKEAGVWWWWWGDINNRNKTQMILCIHNKMK